MKPENALVSRRVFAIDGGRVCIEEVWDTSHPDSPWVSVLQWPPTKPNGEYIRQVIMNSEEFWRANIPLKLPDNWPSVG